MSLGIALTNAISGVRVNQEAMSILSTNIANANSKDYTRREIVQSSQVVNGVASGVNAEGVRRAVDEFVSVSARRQLSNVKHFEIQQEYYDRLENFIGTPGDESNIGAKFDNFFARLGDLANSPEQATLRTNALQAGIGVAASVSTLAGNINKLRFDADQEIKQQVNTFNTLLKDLQGLNSSIEQAIKLGTETNSLFDKRDVMLSQVSEIMDVQITLNESGQTTIILPRTDLLSPSGRFELEYHPSSSVVDVTNEVGFNAITARLVGVDGTLTGTSYTLFSGTNDPKQEQFFTSGTIKGLIDIRDTEFPRSLQQLNELAQTFADSFNALHNDGGGFPPASTLTGTRLSAPTENHVFSGNLRIAVLNADGSPVAGSYGNNNFPPLTINFDTLTSNGTAGEVNLNAIVNEINEYYGPPASQQASLGVVSDIKLAAVSDNIASTHATGSMVFSGNLGVGDTITVGNTTYTMTAGSSSGTNIKLGSTLTTSLVEIARVLNSSSVGNTATASYSVDDTTLIITHKTAGTSPNGTFALDANLTPGATGSTANINGVGAAVNPAASALGVGTGTAGVNANGNFTFDFDMTNLSSDDATFEVLDITINGGASTGLNLGPFTSEAGLRQRTNKGGDSSGESITVAIPAGVEEGGTFTVSANIRVVDGDGTITTDTITYTVTIPDPNANIINKRYPASASGIAASLTAVVNASALAKAEIVDANGKVITDGSAGYLKITALRTGTGIVMDELDSKEKGLLTNPSGTATNRGVSHYYGLNDFFTTGDSLQSAAGNFAVRDDYKNNAARLATAELVLSNQPSDPTALPRYTYETGIGSNKLVSRLAELKNARAGFDAAGGLPAVTLTFGGYSSEILSSITIAGGNIDSSLEQENTIYTAFKEKMESSGGVNIDEELANTVLFQNNFNASARLITILSNMFERIIDSF